MSQIPTTVKITDDPLGLQAKGEHAHLLANASVTQTRPEAAPIPVPVPVAVSSRGKGKAPAPAQPPAAQPAPQGHVPGNVTIHHKQVILHGGSGVEVPSNNGSTRVVIHRPLVTQEVAPGVHIHQGYAPAPGEVSPEAEARPLLESSHAKAKRRPAKKTKAKKVRSKK